MTIICVCLAGPCSPLQHCYHLSELKLGSSCSLCHFCQHGDVIVSQKFITCFSWWESHNHLLVWTESTRNRHLLCLLLILIPYADINKFCLIRAVDKRSLQLLTVSLNEGLSADMVELICSHFISVNFISLNDISGYQVVFFFFMFTVWLRFQQCNSDMQLIWKTCHAQWAPSIDFLMHSHTLLYSLVNLFPGSWRT